MHGPLNAVLLLDNRDSFVWNLAQALQTLGQDVHVARSDAVDVGQIEADPPKALVVSPGPGRPDDAGCSVAAIRALSGHLPILGVCLGHQALAVAFGGSVFRSPPCHGKPWPIHHDGGPMERVDSRITSAVRSEDFVRSLESLPNVLSPPGQPRALDDRCPIGTAVREFTRFQLQDRPGRVEPAPVGLGSSNPPDGSCWKRRRV